MAVSVRRNILSIIIIYLIACALLYVFQRNLIYFPSTQAVPLDHALAHERFQEITATTADGLTLKGWYAPAGAKKYTLVFFHGNADSLRSASMIASVYINAGYGFLVTEYRGYSGLPGNPTEDGLYHDGRAFMQALKDAGVDESTVVLFGHSLGSGVAVQLATEFKVAGLILLAPLLSVVDVAQKRFFIFPVSLMVKDRFANSEKIANVSAPILIAHGGRDNIVPPEQGQGLFQLARQPKEFKLFLDDGHNDIFDNFITVSLPWLDQLGQ